MALTKDCIKALRTAKDISFHYRYERSYMNATLSREPNRTNVEIDCHTQTFNYIHNDKKVVSGFAMIQSALHSEEWQTIVGFMKPGDELTLSWRANAHGNGDLTKVDFVGDSLSLKIVRGEKKFVFHVTSVHCPAHSSARMCTLA